MEVAIPPDHQSAIDKKKFFLYFISELYWDIISVNVITHTKRPVEYCRNSEKIRRNSELNFQLFSICIVFKNFIMVLILN